MSEFTLEAKNLYKSYGPVHALNDVSISVPKGSVYGLLGPNGAGKTSLIRILTQIIAQDKGTILFNDVPLNRDHISQLGYMPEERGLYKKMKVHEQLVYLGRLKGMTRVDANTEASDWLRRLGLDHVAKKKTEELSKGMSQKVQFIATIINRPKFLILDEPFSGFDPVNAELIKNQMLALNKEGCTLLLSSHRMESVEELCSHMTLLNKAQVVTEGRVSDIQLAHRKYHNALEISKVCSSEDLGKLNEKFGGNIISSNSSNYSISLPDFDGSTTGDVLSAYSKLGKIERYGVHLPSMNQIFIDLVGGGNE